MSASHKPTCVIATTTVEPSDLRAKSSISDSDLAERKSTPNFNANLETINECGNQSANWIQLLKNEKLWIRLLIIFIIQFLSILSLAFAYGQIYELELNNYWCDRKTIEEIRNHSVEIGSQTGEDDSCWQTKDFVTNDTALWDNYGGYQYKPISNTEANTKCGAFYTLFILYLFIVIYSVSSLIIDAFRYKQGTLGKFQYVKQMKKQNILTYPSTYTSSSCIAQISQYWNRFQYWYKHILLPPDSGKWCLLMICRDIFEITLQIQALLLYNGTNLFDKNDVYLANEPKYIKVFAVFLFLNGVSS